MPTASCSCPKSIPPIRVVTHPVAMIPISAFAVADDLIPGDTQQEIPSVGSSIFVVLSLVRWERGTRASALRLRTFFGIASDGYIILSRL